MVSNEELDKVEAAPFTSLLEFDKYLQIMLVLGSLSLVLFEPSIYPVCQVGPLIPRFSVEN